MTASTSISATKLAIRSSMKHTLSSINAEVIEQQSRAVISRLVELPEFQACTAVSVFISMKAEVQTQAIIEAALALDKKVFIPKIVGKKASDMIMVRLPSFEHIASFPKNKWGIPEPDVVEDQGMEQVDFVVVPGVAFTSRCERLGHGKGYYDCFIERLENARRASHASHPILVGVGLDEQILINVPTEDHDRVLDYVLCPKELFCRAKN